MIRERHRYFSLMVMMIVFLRQLKMMKLPFQRRLYYLVKTHDTSMHPSERHTWTVSLEKLIWCELHNHLFLVCIANDDVDMSTITTRASCVPSDTQNTHKQTRHPWHDSLQPKHTHKWTWNNGKWEFTHNPFSPIRVRVNDDAMTLLL